MVQIVLIRPGSTDFDAQGRIQGTLDIPLSEQGSAEVSLVVQQLRDLKLEAVYASSCQAAWETATALAEGLDLKLKKLDKMQNLDHGLWQGMLVEDVRRKQPKVYRQWQEQPENVCPPEGEMLSQARARVQQAIAKLVKKHKSGTIGLVVPEPLASVVHSYLAQCELGDLWKSGCGCGRWEVISFEPQSVAPASS